MYPLVVAILFSKSLFEANFLVGSFHPRAPLTQIFSKLLTLSQKTIFSVGYKTNHWVKQWVTRLTLWRLKKNNPLTADWCNTKGNRLKISHVRIWQLKQCPWIENSDWFCTIPQCPPFDFSEITTVTTDQSSSVEMNILSSLVCSDE